MCSVHPLPFLKPACSSEKVPVCSRCFLSLCASSRSMTFSHVFISEMGRWFRGSRSPCFLGMRHISALLNCSGTSSVVHICWTSSTVISTAVTPPFLSISAAMPSGPGALLFGSCLMTASMSSLVGISLSGVYSSCHSS